MTRPSASKARYSHSGICVADIERSRNFYRQALDFVDGRELRIVNDQHGLLGLEGDFELHSVFLRRDGLIIELLHFTALEPSAGTFPRPLNQIGLTHLSFNVDDLDTAIAEVEAAGGRVLPSTRTVFPLDGTEGEIVFVTDPDGTRIELVAFPEDVCNA